MIRKEPRNTYKVSTSLGQASVSWLSPLEGRTSAGPEAAQRKMPARIDGPKKSIKSKGWFSPTTTPRDARNYWLFQGEVYSSEHELAKGDVKALILEAENKVKLRLARARMSMEAVELLESEPKHGRRPIPDDVKMYVWQRDGGVCVKCGSNENLEFDHIIPVSKGGANTARNLQLLCQRHNGEKGGNLV